MNNRTLYVLFGIVMLIGGALILYDPASGKTDAPNPLTQIVWSDVERLECRTADRKIDWVIERDEAGWKLTAPDLANGRPVRGDDAWVGRVLGLLAGINPQGEARADEVDLEKVGIDPPEVTVKASDPSRTLAIEFGKEDINRLVFFRVNGADMLFQASAHVVQSLVVPSRQLRDPRLATVALHEVRRLTVARRGEKPFSLERLAARWYIRGEDGTTRADTQLCNEYVNGLLQVGGDPAEYTAQGDPLCVVTVEEGEGESAARHEFRVLGVDEEDGTYYACRADDPDVRKVDRMFKRFIDRRPEELVDRILTGFKEVELSSIRIEGPGRPLPLSVVKKKNRWYVELEQNPTVRIDADRFGAFRDALLNCMVESTSNEATAFEADVKATFSLAADAELPPVIVELSAPRADGTRLARRSDERGVSVVAAPQAAAFLVNYWDVILHAVEFGMDTRVDWIKITDEAGAAYEVNRVTKGGQTRWDRNGLVVPDEVLQGLLNKLVYLTVDGFLGQETPEARAGFEKPRFKVEWRHKSSATTGPLVISDDDRYLVWTVGRLVDDSWYECRINTFPDLVFRIPGEELAVITDAVRGIDRAR